MNLTPPTDDSEAQRHRFYAALASAMQNIAQSQERTFKVLSEVEGSIADQHKFQTRIYALGSAFTLIWFLVSGGIGWYAQRVISQYDAMAAKVDKMERIIELAEYKAKPLDALPDKVDAMRSRLAQVENEIDKMRGKP
jgi:hypothetical protein